MMIESRDEEQIIDRVAALDIGKAELVCCVRIPDEGHRRKRLQEVSTHTTMTPSLAALAEYLVDLRIERVVMEATSDYWKPVFYLLEAHGLNPWLVNARDVKHLPGRPKTDVLDSVWLCKVAERQMLRPSFVPPVDIRRLRDFTRYRVSLVSARTEEKNRVEKLLEDACIKLSVVASDIFGVSGRAMMAALIAGERNPQVLAQLARSRMRSKIPRLEEAFTGFFDEHHRFLLARMLGRIDGIDADIAAVDEQIGQELAPFVEAAQRLAEIPGIGAVAAAAILAETGLDMTRFPTDAHLCSWAKFSPSIKSSAGKNKGSGATGRGNSYPRPYARRSNRQRRKDQHVPRRTLPALAQAPRQETGGRRRGAFHPRHHLAPALRPRSTLPRPRTGLHQPQQEPRNNQAQSHPQTREPRLQRHPHPGRLKPAAPTNNRITPQLATSPAPMPYALQITQVTLFSN